MDLEGLRAQRNDLVAKMQTIMDAGTLTDEQAMAFDAAEKEFGIVDANVKRAEKLAAHAAAMAVPRPSVAERQIAERIVAGGPEASREFESFGHFMHAVRFDPNDPRLEFHTGLQADQSMGTGTEGGFAVPKQFLGELLSVAQQPAVIRPLATVIPPGTPPDAEISMPALDQADSANMYGGVTVGWIGEVATLPSTSAALKQVTLVPKEVAATITVSNKLLRNWQASDTVIKTLLGKAITAAEENAFLTGNGINKPLGFITSKAPKVTGRATAGTVTLADLLQMEANLLANSNAVWLMSPRVRQQIRGLSSATTGGSLIWGDGHVNTGAPNTLLGRNAYVVDRMPQLGNRGDICLVDLSYFLIKDGSGPFIATSEHVLFTSNRTVIKAFWNVDGQPWLTKPLTWENGDIVSPFSILDVVGAQ